MHFTNPLNLAYIPIVVACLYALLRFLVRRDASNVLSYSSLAFAERVLTRNAWLERCIAILLLGGAAAATSAFAGPKFTAQLPQRDGAVVLCVDTSGSMASTDILPTRAQAALHAMHVFVEHLPQGVKVGVVSFSTSANPVLAPDSDHDSANQAIDRVPAPNGATAIGDALLLSEQMLPKAGRRAVVLLTDGVNNRGADPVEAAHDLAAHHITLYTVGIGTNNSGRMIPGTNEAADADPDALRAYAEVTGGVFVAVSDAEAVSTAFLHLAREASWQYREVDAAVPAAVLGAVLILCAVFMLLSAGRLPTL